MRLIRWFLGKIILFLDRVFSPTPIQRSLELQSKADQACSQLSLYQFEMCPFCVKVRREIRRKNLKIEIRDVKKVQAFADELKTAGGQIQVPCLRIVEANKSVRWLYESSDIIGYLNSFD